MCFNVSIYKTNCVEMLRPCNHCFVETRENKGESRCLRQAQKLPVGGRLKQKRELANLGNKQVKEAEKSNKCKKSLHSTKKKLYVLFFLGCSKDVCGDAYAKGGNGVQDS
ncbi:hypothetical protein Bca4012_044921 [Brassica carinata]